MPNEEEGSLELSSPPVLPAGGKGVVRLTYRPRGGLSADTRLWLMLDIRQDAGKPQAGEPTRPNHVRASTSGGDPLFCEPYRARTLDLYPRLPEFLHVCEMILPRETPRGATITIHLGGEGAGWEYPAHPIPVFHFWLAVGADGECRFLPTGFRGYRVFSSPSAAEWVPEVLSASATFQGELPGFSAENTRPTPGILWGDLHGMAFNQRPLDDFYHYARQVARFDFAAAMLFSYNICVEGVWEGVKRTAANHTRPGEFVAVPGVEFGTPPDDSHRNAHFFHPEDVPPIFFEGRPPAHDPRLMTRFSKDTLFPRDLDEFYATVRRHGGIVSGHFHTHRYDREVMAEIWQKQTGSAAEEGRIFELLNRGFRLGIAGGSDTHDSMPGNPRPEPSCPQTAGFMAVPAEQATPDAILEAIRERRIYATTGARIALRFEAHGRPMGSLLPTSAPRAFIVRVEGSAELDRLELIRGGREIDRAEPVGYAWEGVLRDPAKEAGDRAWYLLRVRQRDGHRAWSSPIWFD